MFQCLSRRKLPAPQYLLLRNISALPLSRLLREHNVFGLQTPRILSSSICWSKNLLSTQLIPVAMPRTPIECNSKSPLHHIIKHPPHSHLPPSLPFLLQPPLLQPLQKPPRQNSMTIPHLPLDRPRQNPLTTNLRHLLKHQPALLRLHNPPPRLTNHARWRIHQTLHALLRRLELRFERDF